MRSANRTPHGTRAVSITIPDDAVLDVDDQGHGLLRLSLAVRQRGTRETKLVEFDFPTLGEWHAYQEECANLFVTMAQGVPDLWMPDDMEAVIRSVDGYRTWAAVAAAICHRPMIANQLKSIVTNYLDPMVPGVDNGSEWLLANLTVAYAVHMLALVLCVEQFLEKKTRSAMIGIFRVAMPQRYSGDSPKPQGPTSTRSSGGPAPGLSFSSGGTPNTTPQ